MDKKYPDLREFDEYAEFFIPLTAEDLKEYKDNDLYQMQYDLRGVVDYYSLYHEQAVEYIFHFHNRDNIDESKIATIDNMIADSKKDIEKYLKLLAVCDMVDEEIESRNT